MTNIGGTSDVPDNVAGDVESAWNENEAADAGIAGPPQPSQGGDRSRDEFGRFAAQPSQQALASPPGTADQAPGALPSPAPGAAPLQGPPSSWSPAAKAAYQQLPPDHPIRQAVEKREQETAQGFQRYQQQFKGLENYSQMAEQAGKSLPQVLDEYVAAQNYLAQDFPAGINWLMQSFGWTPEQLYEAFTGQQYQGQNGQLGYQQDPTMQYLRQLDERVGSIQQQWQSQRDEQVNGQLEEFAQDHIWLWDVQDHMADQIRANPQLSLQEAYDNACWAHPEIRPILFEHFYGNGQSNGRTNAPPSNRGRSLNPGSPIPGVSTGTRAPKNSVLDEVSAAYDELMP